MTARPWFKWYPGDWRAEPTLRMCSRAARSFWVDLLGLMHESVEYGKLLINGIKPTTKQLAGVTGDPERDVKRWLDELGTNGVYSVGMDGVIFSRRMVRDADKAARDKANGKGGGNPNLIQPDNQWVNPPVKAHMPEAISQGQKEKTNGAARPGGYAFEGRVVRLTPQDFTNWRKAFPDIDLVACLQNRDDWLQAQPENDRKNWFQSTSSLLAKKQNEVAAAKRTAAPKGLGPA